MSTSFGSSENGGGPSRRTKGGRGRGNRGARPPSDRGQPSHQGSTPQSQDRAPRNVCNYYWSSGACRYGFQCIFRHEEPSNTHPTEPSPEDHALDFFSAEGLSEQNGIKRDAMTPAQVHNHLLQFLKGGSRTSFAYSAPSRIEPFARLFGSLQSGNKAWSPDLAQTFLDTVVQGEALQLVEEVLKWDNVTISRSPTALSFQRAYFPLLEFFVSDHILKTTMDQNVNKLYTLIDSQYDNIHTTLSICIAQMVNACTWRDPGYQGSNTQNLSGVSVFKVVASLYSEYILRFKKAFREHPQILQFIQQLYIFFEIWSTGVQSNPPTFHDIITSSPSQVRQLTIRQLQKEIDVLLTICRRECGVADSLRRPARHLSTISKSMIHEDFVALLEQADSPPGELRPGGPRHDNDFKEIQNIQIAPTHDELLSHLSPYLPCFVPGGPHHLPSGSMEKHLDIQFRLLREEMIATIRQSVNAITGDLSERQRKPRELTMLQKLIKARGGAYRTTGYNSTFFHLYTNATFAAAQAERQNFYIRVSVDAPPGQARAANKAARKEYWEHSRKLSSGNLVALVLVSSSAPRVYLGKLVSSSSDIAASSTSSPDRIEVRIAFFDPEVEIYALKRERMTRGKGAQYDYGLLVDNSVLFDGVAPFLSSLQKAEPTSIPFSEYISTEGSLRNIRVPPPLYAQAPGFKFALGHLLPANSPSRQLGITHAVEVEMARRELRRRSKLDVSQADAVVDALSREVALIQGPPGTGKSFTGKEILRVLFASNVRPIVLMAYTNHALDHMLRAVLDEKITSRIARLGSRSKDERVATYNLTELEKLADRSAMETTKRREYRRMKDAEEDMLDILVSIQMPEISWSDIEEYIGLHHPDAYDAFEYPPLWICLLKERLTKEVEDEGVWTSVKKGGKVEKLDIPATNYGFWSQGFDIRFLSNRSAIQLHLEEGAIAEDSVATFLDAQGISEIPNPPNSRQRFSDEELLDTADPWSLDAPARLRLKTLWEDEVRRFAYNTHLEEFRRRRHLYEEACENYQNVCDQVRKELLAKTDLIACTTTGAAKLVSLLKAIAPKVLMMEEAGQILECHTLAALVPSIQHMICIGDPQQLRPTLQNFSLSVDNEKGKKLYKFDRSLMERLSDEGYPMSLITVQRRMRPSIARFPRLMLYPTLEDNPIVLQYPPVQGLQSDVFFVTHTQKEGGEEDSLSKYNTHEVDWIRSLVTYLLRQGTYGGKGDIAVLCAYLGQLMKVRAALRNAKLAVTMNERDQAELARMGEEESITEEFQNINVGQHIRLGTVDTFQGEEAKIVIISLVRNSGDFAGDSPIGFLKVVNRINVALSRAQHGMYIFGNAANLRKNPTWSIVLDSLEEDGQIGPALPTICPRHPDAKYKIAAPRDLDLVAPEGGCLATCGYMLDCGHICKSVCHPDLNQHRRMVCNEPCPRITCPSRHPCERLCGEECGTCRFPVYNIRLPCGHVAEQVTCEESMALDQVYCSVAVRKSLLSCEHNAVMHCSQDPSVVQCHATCNQPLSCCFKTCKAECWKCAKRSTQGYPSQQNSSGRITRFSHAAHPCDRQLYCQHACGVDCSENHQCNDACRQQCRQSCKHQTCSKPCSVPCPPCLEACGWRCEHYSCPVPCGSVCARLPCDVRCRKVLKCGHPCPSVCGEPCEDQKCTQCPSSDEDRSSVVDFILQRKISELALDSDDLAERTITLGCGHVFTIETLDAHCTLSNYYDVDPLTGSCTAMKAPPINYQKPPTCPNCRGPITSPRYGRVTKRATLDILEQNVASQMSKDISRAAQDLSDLRLANLEQAVSALPPMKPLPKSQLLEAAKEREGKAKKFPISTKLLRSVRASGLGDEEFESWRALLAPLLKPYQTLAVAAVKKGPHVKCYEAALSTLYRQELANVFSNLEEMGGSLEPEPRAMEEVEKKIGQPPHKADTRFQVEALFMTVQIRGHMIHLGLKRFDEVAKSPMATTATQGDNAEGGSPKEELIPPFEGWRSYVGFLVDSCIRDLQTAQKMAKASSSHRQSVRCDAHILRMEVENFKLSTIALKRELTREGRYNEVQSKAFLDLVRRKKAVVLLSLRRLQDSFLRMFNQESDRNVMAQQRSWFEENVSTEVSMEDFEDLEKYLKTDAGMSMREKAEIVKAFGFGYRGHFYNCENGHTFVITECGGAMQEARCPECRAPIGGSHHQLHHSNTRAREYEEIAQQQGSMNPHWPWQQGA